MAEPTQDGDERLAARPALVRIPSAIIGGCVLASIVLTVWVYAITKVVPHAVEDFIGPLLLFALAPIAAGLLLRRSRWWVRVLVGMFTAYVWVFWLFVVLIPVTS